MIVEYFISNHMFVHVVLVKETYIRSYMVIVTSSSSEGRYDYSFDHTPPDELVYIIYHYVENHTACVVVIPVTANQCLSNVL